MIGLGMHRTTIRNTASDRGSHLRNIAYEDAKKNDNKTNNKKTKKTRKQ